MISVTCSRCVILLLLHGYPLRVRCIPRNCGAPIRPRQKPILSASAQPRRTIISETISGHGEPLYPASATTDPYPTISGLGKPLSGLGKPLSGHGEPLSGLGKPLSSPRRTPILYVILCYVTTCLGCLVSERAYPASENP